jgi:membrane protein implicated in regulation of membrane protease activity
MTIFYFYLLFGIGLIIAEIITNTFYLLVIGVAFLLSGIAAIFIANWWYITLCAVILSLVNCVGVYLYKKSKYNQDGQLVINRIGQEVEVVEIFADHLNVTYSGSFWPAKLTKINLADIKIGDTLKITKFNNNELEVSR